MKILVFGAGAIGCFYGAAMALAGSEVTLYLRNGKRADIIAENGLALRYLDGRNERRAHPEVCGDLAALGGYDLALLAVKAYDTEQAAAQLSSVPGDFPVLILQNGLADGKRLSAYFASRRLLPTVIYEGARLANDNTVICAGPGSTIVTAAAEEGVLTACKTVEFMKNCGLEACFAARSDFPRFLWEKLIVNSVINPLTAVNNVVNGRVLADKKLSCQARKLAEEGVAVANSLGISLDMDRIWQALQDTCKHSFGNRSSMLEDIAHGRPTEIRQINGAIVDAGRQKGIATPLNEEMQRKIIEMSVIAG